MHNGIRHGLVMLALVLSLWLVWGFWQLDAVLRFVLTGALVLLSVAYVLNSRQADLRARQAPTPPYQLPPPGFRGTLVLVCGSHLPLTSAQLEQQTGWYLCVDTPADMQHVLTGLATERPELVSSVAFLLTVIPSQTNDKNLLQEEAFAWRRAIAQSRNILDCQPETWVAIYLDAVQAEAADYWFTAHAGQSLHVWKGTEDKGTFEHWSGNARDTSSTFQTQLHLEYALQWWQQQGLPLWQIPQAGTAPVSVHALAVCFLPLASVTGNLWHAWLDTHTGLQTPPHASGSQQLPFPHVLFTRQQRRLDPTRLEKTMATFGAICAVFLLLAILASYQHNQRLIQHAEQDLALFRSLSGEPIEPKLLAQQQLQSSAQQLLRWEREGVPPAYNLGLYQGGRVLPHIQAALAEWTPPPPVIEIVEQVVTLDSLALFATGQATLKEHANKVLIEALLNIKARPGWLIVVTGHTDNTGSTELNQQLSKRRAEAVRDWMLSVSDLSANCFAVQGLGDTRPVADNNSEEGRGKNRRVEIRLFPQADACQDANINNTSSFAQDDVVSLQMEK